MKNRKSGLREKAAFEILAVLLANYKGDGEPPVEELTVKAWKYADAFIKTGKNEKLNRYFSIMKKYPPSEALRRIFVEEGMSAYDALLKVRKMQYEKERLMDGRNLLRIYANEYYDISTRTAEQIIVDKWLKLQGDDVDPLF